MLEKYGSTFVPMNRKKLQSISIEVVISFVSLYYFILDFRYCRWGPSSTGYPRCRRRHPCQGRACPWQGDVERILQLNSKLGGWDNRCQRPRCSFPVDLSPIYTLCPLSLPGLPLWPVQTSEMSRFRHGD